MAHSERAVDLDEAIEANRRAQGAAATFRLELERSRADSLEEEIAACRRALVPVTGRSLSAPNYSQQVAHVGWPPFRGAHQPFFKEKGSEPEPHPDVLDRRGSRTYRLMHQLQAWRKDELRQLSAGVRQATQETLLARGITALERITGGGDLGEAAAAMLAGIPPVMAKYLPSAPVQDADSLRAWSTAIQDVPEHVLESAAELVDWDQVASRFVPTRSAEECRLRWVNLESPQVTRARWTKVERDKLCAVAARHQGRHWEAVAAGVGTGRSAWQCYCEYTRLQDAEKRVTWSPAEDEQLHELVERFGHENWTQVAVFLGKDATPLQCSMRWAKLGPVRRQGAWTAWEDRRLLLAHEACGDSWTEVASFLPGRTHAQCRERYTFVLRRKRRPERQDGDAARLAALLETHGSDWSAVARGMGRTGKSFRHLMHSLIKRKPPGRLLKDSTAFVRAVFAAQRGALAPAPPSSDDQGTAEPQPEPDSSSGRPRRKRSRRASDRVQQQPPHGGAEAGIEAPARPVAPLALMESFAEEALRLPAMGPSQLVTLRSCSRAGIRDRRLWSLLLRNADYVGPTVRRRVRTLFESRGAAEEATRAAEDACGPGGQGAAAGVAASVPSSAAVAPMDAAGQHLGATVVGAARYLHGKVMEQLARVAERHPPPTAPATGGVGPEGALTRVGEGVAEGEGGELSGVGASGGMGGVEAHLSLQTHLRQRVWAHAGPRVAGSRYLTSKAEAEALAAGAAAAGQGSSAAGAASAARSASAAASGSWADLPQPSAGETRGDDAPADRVPAPQVLASHGAVSHAAVEAVVREMECVGEILRRVEVAEQAAVSGGGGGDGRERVAAAVHASLAAVREACELVAILVSVVAALDAGSEPIASELAPHLVALWVVAVR